MNYKLILARFYKCKLCNYPLVMDGCENSNCKNYYKKLLKKQFNNFKKKSVK